MISRVDITYQNHETSSVQHVLRSPPREQICTAYTLPDVSGPGWIKQDRSVQVPARPENLLEVSTTRDTADYS